MSARARHTFLLKMEGGGCFHNQRGVSPQSGGVRMNVAAPNVGGKFKMQPALFQLQQSWQRGNVCEGAEERD